MILTAGNNSESNDIVNEYKVLLNELKKYNPELLDKKRILGISKSDLLDEELEQGFLKEINKRIKGKNKIPIVFFSSQTQKGIKELKNLIWENIK